MTVTCSTCNNNNNNGKLKMKREKYEIAQRNSMLESVEDITKAF